MGDTNKFLLLQSNAVVHIAQTRLSAAVYYFRMSSSIGEC